MAEFQERIHLVARLGRLPRQPLPLAPSLRHGRPLPRLVHAQLEELRLACSDPGTRIQVERLHHRLLRGDWGQYESAKAELDHALLLLRHGIPVAMVPETQQKTADFRCDRPEGVFYAEVTAMIGRGHRRSQSLRRCLLEAEGEEKHDPDRHTGWMLILRICARIVQKAKQLQRYTDPVLLAVTLPRPLWARRSDRESVDLSRLVGAVTVMLPKVPHVSAVLISLWHVDPQPLKACLRFDHVTVMERSKLERDQPRVRALLFNPWAGSQFREEPQTVLKGLV